MNPAAKRRKWIPSRDPIREMTVSIDFWVWTADEHLLIQGEPAGQIYILATM